MYPILLNAIFPAASFVPVATTVPTSSFTSNLNSPAFRFLPLRLLVPSKVISVSLFSSLFVNSAPIVLVIPSSLL